MSNLRLPLLCAVAVLAVTTAGALAALQAPPAGAAVPLSDAILARLKTSGLLPGDPQLHDKLAALAQAHTGDASARIVSQLHGAKTTSAPVELFRRAALAPGLQLTTTQPVVTGITVTPASPFSSMTLTGQHLILGGANPPSPTITMNLGACGTSQYGPASTPTPAMLIMGELNLPVYDEKSSLVVSNSGTPNPNSAPVSFVYPALKAGAGLNAAFVAVTSKAPYFSDFEDLGLGASTFSASSTDRVSTDPTGSGASGTDVLGLGVSLVNGWTATANITAVHSYRDAPSDRGSNDIYRSATVSQQPASGRLETRVSWKHEAGESISYTLEWVFENGSLAGRWLTTERKNSGCNDEQ